MSYFEIKCTKFDSDWDSAPNPAEELTALLRTIYRQLDLRSPSFKGRGWKEGRGIEGKGRKRSGEGLEWSREEMKRFASLALRDGPHGSCVLILTTCVILL